LISFDFMSPLGSLKSKMMLHWSIFCMKRSWRRLGGTSWKPGSFSSSRWRWSDMSNLDECCLFGVRMPSGTSFGVACSRSNKSDFWPAFGGATSPGIVSIAPGGGICCGKDIVSKFAMKRLTSGRDRRSTFRPWKYRTVRLTPGALGLTTTLGGS